MSSADDQNTDVKPILYNEKFYHDLDVLLPFYVSMTQVPALMILGNQAINYFEPYDRLISGSYNHNYGYGMISLQYEHHTEIRLWGYHLIQLFSFINRRTLENIFVRTLDQYNHDPHLQALNENDIPIVIRAERFQKARPKQTWADLGTILYTDEPPKPVFLDSEADAPTQ